VPLNLLCGSFLCMVRQHAPPWTAVSHTFATRDRGANGSWAKTMTSNIETPKSDFLRILTERGFIHQCSDIPGLDALAAKGQAVGYIGFDCTASSLHAGGLVQIMMLHWLEATGNKAIALMGGGTTMVGDPSGKDETRKMLTVEQIQANKDGIKQVFAKFLSFGPESKLGPKQAVMPDNAEWLLKLNYIEMLREIGRHFSVNRMLTLESVKSRLERAQEMTFIEFNYQILQAYDFVELARRYGSNLQMGGSDQWGNIVTGIDLGRRMGTHQLYALTTPLLATSSGAKMGKTVAGAVWLNEDMLSAYDYWQYWRNAEDADVGRFLKLFTKLPMAEIAKLEALAGAEINEAKKVLATAATTLVHGRDKAEAAAATALKTFETGTLATDLPTIQMKATDLQAGISVLAAFVAAGLVKSNGEAKRQIQGGGLRINDVAITDEKAVLSATDLTSDGVIKLSFGKKKHVLVKAG
jgi:tyrosyl-tRNA synthetase